jgi:hypothetical protein
MRRRQWSRAIWVVRRLRWRRADASDWMQTGGGNGGRAGRGGGGSTAGANGRRGGGDRDGGRQRARMGGEAVETATAGDGVRGWEARWRRPRRRATASADGRRGGGDRNGGRQRPRMGGEAVETATAGDSVRGWEARRGREVTGDALWKVVGGSDMQVDARRA